MTTVARVARTHSPTTACSPASCVARRSPYRLRIDWPDAVQETEDPYSFGPLLGELDLHLLAEGTHLELGRCLGAHADARSTAWPACASRSGRRMRGACRWSATSTAGTAAGIRCAASRGRRVGNVHSAASARGTRYKYEIPRRARHCCRSRPIPCALQAEVPPATASIVAAPQPLCMDRRRLDGAARATQRIRCADVDLRSACRVVAARRATAIAADWDELADG